jgi:hypothetical protein
MSTDSTISRRALFMKLGILFNGLVAAALAVPVVRFLLSPIIRGRANGYLSWVSLGSVSQFPEGETRLATFRNPYVTPTDGKTADTAFGYGASKHSNSRFSPLIARISAAPCVGFHSPGCSCARVTAVRITRMAHAPPARRNVDCSSIRTPYATA